jgi:hypothetical protein
MVVTTAKDEPERKALDDIRKYGLHVMGVHEDEYGPDFAYSIGLFQNYAHPEVIIIGLEQPLAHAVLNDIADDVKKGKTYRPGEFYTDLLESVTCFFGEVATQHYAEFVGWARWFYEGDDFPLLQCVYPTVTGIFPWEKNFPEETRWYCPMLTDPPPEQH